MRKIALAKYFDIKKTKTVVLYNKKVQCSNCGKTKIPFAKKLLENNVVGAAFQDICISCATRQILAHPIYDKKYIETAKKCNKR